MVFINGILEFELKLIIVLVISVWFLVTASKYLKIVSNQSHNTRFSDMKQDMHTLTHFCHV